MLVWNYSCQSYYATCNEHMVKATNKYRNQIVDMLRDYRHREVWGCKNRRPEMYSLISERKHI